MRSKLLFIFLLISISYKGFCTVWTIKNSGNTFTPSVITINTGDTVNFDITSGHDGREVSEATWNAKGNTHLAGGFQTPFGGGLVLPAQLGAGTHYYVCTPHAFIGMLGRIIVQDCNIPAVPGPISGNISICAGTSNLYSINAVTDASSYSWTLPNGWSGNSISSSITVSANNKAGSIAVAAINACGSSQKQTLNISMNNIDISVSVNSDTLKANHADAVYQWVDCNSNTPIPGEDNQSFFAPSSGSYAVIITQNGCSETSDCLLLTPLDIIENNYQNTISIYPNPSDGSFQISLNDSKEIKNVNLDIYNIEGKLVYHSIYTNPNTEIDISKIIGGLYILQIKNGQSVLCEKIIIVK